MSAQNNGGPAFPVNTENNPNAGACYPTEGISARDYFAAKAPISTQDAMTACFIDANTIGVLNKIQRMEVMEMLSEMQMEYADAMLAERSK